MITRTVDQVREDDRLGGCRFGLYHLVLKLVRFHYSTFEGVAASWESKFSRESWPNIWAAVLRNPWQGR